MSGSTKPNNDQASNEAGNAPPWLSATLEDVEAVEFEAPLVGVVTADCREISDLYSAASTLLEGSTDLVEGSSRRVFTMLCAVTGMHFKPDDRNEPFGPMKTFADGRRSAIASDFRSHVDLIADLAGRAKNPVLRARLSDLCWILERKRGNLALAAISAYTEIVERTDRKELKLRFAKEGGALEPDMRDYLQRSLQIGRAVGWEKTEILACKELVKRLQKQAADKFALVPVYWFYELDLDFAISEPAGIGEAVDALLAQLKGAAESHLVVDLWRLAARAYHAAKREADKYRCLAEAAEQLVAETGSQQGSAILAAHTLSSAIAQLHGVPDKKERRLELRHKLIDIQARVPEEMTTLSQEFEVREMAEGIQTAIGKGDIVDALFVFAGLATSPDPKKLAFDAAESIRAHPLASLFGSSHLDREGKVIHRSKGGGLGDHEDDSAITRQVAQSEQIRRNLVAFGAIEAARHAIMDRYYISDDVLLELVKSSPFVPADLTATFARGFARFFQGDLVSATYILTPLLEGSLRYILKINGHDVTTFDDATQTQQDRTISKLFEQMRMELDGVLTPAISSDIERLFLNKPGPHLRHALVHGLLHDGDPYGADSIYGCWLIFRLCLLPLYPQYKENRSRAT